MVKRLSKCVNFFALSTRPAKGRRKRQLLFDKALAEPVAPGALASGGRKAPDNATPKRRNE